jgi:hypothetical protein
MGREKIFIAGVILFSALFGISVYFRDASLKLCAGAKVNSHSTVTSQSISTQNALEHFQIVSLEPTEGIINEENYGRTMVTSAEESREDEKENSSDQQANEVEEDDSDSSFDQEVALIEFFEEKMESLIRTNSQKVVNQLEMAASGVAESADLPYFVYVLLDTDNPDRLAKAIKFFTLQRTVEYIAHETSVSLELYEEAQRQFEEEVDVILSSIDDVYMLCEFTMQLISLAQSCSVQYSHAESIGDLKPLLHLKLRRMLFERLKAVPQKTQFQKTAVDYFCALYYSFLEETM